MKRLTISQMVYGVLVAVTILTACVVWHTEHAGYREGVITISSDIVSASDQQDILEKVAYPFVDYMNSLGGPKLLYVHVTHNPHMVSANDFRFIFSYKTAGDPSESGFLFGANNTVGYWLPQLCDEGGCTHYPDWFRAKYPETYDAFIQAHQATK